MATRSAAEARAEKILQGTTYHDGSRYHVGMLRADDQISLRNNYFSALIQLKSPERRLGKDPKLKEQSFTTIRDEFSKGYIVKVEKSKCFKPTNTVIGFYHTTQCFTLTNLEKSDVCLMEQRSSTFPP